MLVWTQEQTRAFLEANAADPLIALYRLALSVGMRRGELLGLRWRDVDFAKKRLHVQHTLTAARELVEPKTAGSRRAIELPTRAVQALKEHAARQEAAGLETDFVFADSAGKAIVARWLTFAFDRAIAKANEGRLGRDQLPRIRFHDLRHSFASIALSMGEHPKLVSEMLGHSNIGITLNLYSHSIPTLHCAMVDRMNSII